MQKQQTVKPFGQSKLYQKLFHSRIGGILLANTLVLLTFCLLTNFKILSTSNIFRLLRQIAELGIISQGVAILMIAGEFDLSSEAYIALCPILTVFFANLTGNNFYTGLLIAIFAVIMLGIFNGLLVTRTALPSFIATLGTMWIYKGISLIVSDGWVVQMPQNRFTFCIAGTICGFPLSTIWLIVIMLMFSYLLHRCQFGNWIYATGGNMEAAKSVGIKTRRVKVVCYVIVALASSITGLMIDGYIGSLNPLVGEGMTMQAIAAAVVGGVSLTGGSGSIFGILLGTSLMAVINSGLVLMGINAYWQKLAVGVVVIITVILNRHLLHKQ